MPHYIPSLDGDLTFLATDTRTPHVAVSPRRAARPSALLGKAILALTAREILEQEIARKLA